MRHSRHLLTVLATMLLLGVLLPGCERYVPSRDPIEETEEQVARPGNVQVQLQNGAVTLVWEVSNPNGIARFRIYRSDTLGIEYRKIDSVGGTIFTKTISGLALNQFYRFQVAAVSTDGFEGRRSDPVSARVSFVAISVNSDAKLTNTREVEIVVDAPTAVSHIQLSELADLSDAQFRPFSESAPFTLSLGDGPKVVYGRLQFVDGTRSDILASQTITLDTRATIDSVTYSLAVDPPTAGSVITFFLHTSELNGLAGVSVSGNNIPLFDNGLAIDGDAAASDGVYSGRWTIPSQTTIVNGLVEGNFSDEAGNRAVTTTAAKLLNIFSPPLPVTAAAFALSTFQIELTWTDSESESFSAYRVYRAFSPNVTTSSTLLASVSDQSATSFVDSTLTPDTQAYYRVFVFDNSGLSTGSNEVTDRTDVNAAPAAIDFFAAAQPDTTIELTWDASGETDFKSYRIYKSTTATVTTASELVAFITDPTLTEFTTRFDNPPATLYFRIFVFDRHDLNTGSVTRSVSP